jgi:hypothetical protein
MHGYQNIGAVFVQDRKKETSRLQRVAASESALELVFAFRFFAIQYRNQRHPWVCRLSFGMKVAVSFFVAFASMTLNRSTFHSLP